MDVDARSPRLDCYRLLIASDADEGSRLAARGTESRQFLIVKPHDDRMGDFDDGTRAQNRPRAGSAQSVVDGGLLPPPMHLGDGGFPANAMSPKNKSATRMISIKTK
jgi:hypothetical protein